MCQKENRLLNINSQVSIRWHDSNLRFLFKIITRRYPQLKFIGRYEMVGGHYGDSTPKSRPYLYFEDSRAEISCLKHRVKQDLKFG